MNAPLRLMAYNPAWPQEFEQSRSTLLAATDGWFSQVEHIGGTALVGSIAQPVIDLLAGMDDLQGLNEASLRTEGLNFSRLTAPGWCDDELVAYLEKPRGGPATHSVLVVRRGGRAWRRTLAIRAHLENHLLDRQRLENLKQDHLVTGCGAAERYAAAKAAFFEEIAPEELK